MGSRGVEPSLNTLRAGSVSRQRWMGHLALEPRHPGGGGGDGCDETTHTVPEPFGMLRTTLRGRRTRLPPVHTPDVGANARRITASIAGGRTSSTAATKGAASQAAAASMSVAGALHSTCGGGAVSLVPGHVSRCTYFCSCLFLGPQRMRKAFDRVCHGH